MLNEINYWYVIISSLIFVGMLIWMLGEDVDRKLHPRKYYSSKFSYNYKNAFAYIMVFACLPYVNILVFIYLNIIWRLEAHGKI